MAEPIVFAGTVEWTGENPGVSLKTEPDGPFTALASFFRVVFSPHGRGHALVLASTPGTSAAPGNLCITDNEPLARWLIADYVSHFGAWKGLPELGGLRFVAAETVRSEGDPASTYSEIVSGGGTTVRLTWRGLGAPFCFALGPAQSATGLHHMPSVFIGCQSASIEVNGVALPGQPAPRLVAGHPITTAMLAFSETWIRVR
jgi:hypothetical protein